MRHAPLLMAGIAFLLLAPQYWIALLTPATGIYHDDSIYLITARSLAQGHGYLIESLPAVLPQTKYPVLFPALLSLVWRMAPDFPANLPFLKLIPLLAALGWFYASFRLLLTLSLPPLAATAVVCLLAASPQVIFLSTAVLSETTFALLPNPHHSDPRRCRLSHAHHRPRPDSRSRSALGAQPPVAHLAALLDLLLQPLRSLAPLAMAPPIPD